jgi:hypothetical protein
MTLQSEFDNQRDRFVAAGHVNPHGGIYDLPVVGAPARRTRQFFDEMAPTDDDSAGVKAGKNALRYGTVVSVAFVATAVTTVLVF